MAPVSYARHQFSPAIIQHAVCALPSLFLELKFGVLFARELRRRRARTSAHGPWTDCGGDRWQTLLSLARRLISRRALRRFRANAMEQWQAATAAG
jgi:hypothetical protein